jgi:hypothetical protein
MLVAHAMGNDGQLSGSGERSCPIHVTATSLTNGPKCALVQSIAAVNITTDLALVVLPCIVLWNVHVSTSKRIRIIGLIAMRLVYDIPLPQEGIPTHLSQGTHRSGLPNSPPKCPYLVVRQDMDEHILKYMEPVS